MKTTSYSIGLLLFIVIACACGRSKPCYTVYYSLPIRIYDKAGNFVYLDSFYMIREATGQRASEYVYTHHTEEDSIYGYDISPRSDNYDKREHFTFYGFKDSLNNVKQEYVIDFSSCHPSIASGNRNVVVE